MPSPTGASFFYQHPDIRTFGRAYPFLKLTGGAFNPDIAADIDDGLLADGDLVTTGSYWEGSTFGGASYLVVAAGTGTDDGGAILDAGTKQLQATFTNQIDLAHFGCRTGNTPAVNDTAIAAAIAYLGNSSYPSGEITVSERLSISATIDVVERSLRVRPAGTGFGGTVVANSTSSGDLGDGGFRWEGAAGDAMVRLHRTLGCHWMVPLQGNSTNEPSSFIEIDDQAGGSPDNQSTRIGPCRMGGPGNGATNFRATNGVTVLGTTGNDRLIFDGVEIVGCTGIGISMTNANGIWTSMKDVLISGDSIQTPVAIDTIAQFTATNLNINRCDLGIRVTNGSPEITIVQLGAEKLLKLCELADGTQFKIIGGRAQLNFNPSSGGSLPVPDSGEYATVDLDDGGSFSIEHLLFLGMEYYNPLGWVNDTAYTAGDQVSARIPTGSVNGDDDQIGIYDRTASGTSGPLVPGFDLTEEADWTFVGLGDTTRPYLNFTGTRPGGRVEFKGCAELRRADIRFALTGNGQAFVDACFVGDLMNLGPNQWYDGECYRGSIPTGVTAIPTEDASVSPTATGSFTGDGATLTFNIAHNLNITVGVPQIQLRNTTTNEVNPPGGPSYTWVDADTVTATFSTAPAIGVVYEWRAV